MEVSYIFLKEVFSYISGNGTLLYFKKIPHTLGLLLIKCQIIFFFHKVECLFLRQFQSKCLMFYILYGNYFS